ncbi:extended synaptotagmin-1 isoform X11 [Anguilla rostrata]|uniref:extended synaptotagmin-1 isoform X11 n=1 Tax=Anguilla rostrata TaxID=7938 RepID=UPI0030D1EBCF
MEKKPVTMPSGDAAPCGRKVSKPADSAQSRADAPDSGDMQPSKPPGINAVSILWTFGKCLGALLPVYLAGYYRISTSLFMCGLMVYSGWKHTRDAKLARLKSAMQLQDNEQEFTSSKMLKSKRDLPAWVNFPDVEKVEWLNKVLQQAWPFVGQYFEKLLAESIAPSIRASSVHLQTLNFTKVDLGSKAMKVVGVKAHTENDRGQVLLDLYISYVGDVEINVEVKRYFCNAGIKGMQLHGMLRVILEPLIGDVPIVGAVTMFFIRRPQLDINWTGLTNLLDIPGLNVKSDTLIMDAIASFLVLPNRLTVPLVPDLHVAQLRSPLPRGVVRVHLLEAEGLAAKDNLMKGAFSGMSDPYAVVRVGTQTFTSRHVDNELNPKWREMYEVIVHEVPGQELEVEVFDKDPDQDDFLGRTKMDLGIVKKEIVVDEWFTLKDVRSGRVHLRLEWLTLLPTTDQLDQVLERNKSINFPSKTADPPSSAILAVYLDRAEELPMKKGNKDPSPVVQLSVEDITRESRTCYGTNNPVFEDAFTFFIQNPHNQEIDIQVKDTDRILSLGSLTIPLSRLLSCPRLSMDQWFQLDNAGPASRIYINAVLRVLWMDEALSAELAHGVHSRPDSQPEQTSPDSSFATEGVLRIHLVEAQNLIAKDKFLGKGKSDPYVNIRVGGVAFRSHAIQKSLNPTWNELYEVVLTEVPGQEVEVDVFDEDMDQDDFMGRFKISLKDIITSQYTDEWFTLNDVKSGRVHLVLEWLPKVSDPDRLEPVLQFQSQQSYLNKAVPSAAVLFVYMDRAHGLPLKKSGKEPKVGAELILRGTSHKTKVCDRSTSPQWDEAFYFLVRDPEQDMLIVKLTHTGDQPTGSRVLPVRELLSEPGLVLDRWLRLDGALFESQILLRAELKILDAKLAERGVVREGLVGAADSTTSAEGEKEADHTLLMKEESSLSRQKVTPRGGSEVLSPPKTQPQQTTPDPSFAKEGLLRILLVEARDLIAKDKFLGKGKSDPYANIRVGGVAFRSHVIEKNLNPTWNELYEVVLTPQPGQDVQVELFDKDMDRDDFLGRFNVSLNDIITSQYTDQWFTLNDVKSGRVHLVLEWLPKVSDPDRLEQVLQFQSQQSYLNKAVPSAAVLFVYMDRAHGLPMKKSGKEPKVGAELVLGGTSHKTKVCDRSTSPQWDEAFHFLVHDPKHDELIVKLTHTEDQPTGSLVLPVRELLSEPGLVLDRWLSLDGVPPESQILLRAELKILDTKMAERGVVREELVGFADSTTSAEGEEEADHTLLMKEAASSAYREQVSVPEKDKEATAAEVPSPPKTRPQQTTPDPSFATEGLLRILLVEARDLIAKDKFLGKGKSDPYANIRVGDVAFRSHVIEKNLNPTWNELYEVVLTPQPGQDVQVELLDKDMDKDDFLGKFNVSLNDIITSQYTDQWFTLNDVKSGRVHLVLEWLPKVSNPDRLEQVLQFQSQQSYLNKAVPSAAVLFVYMDRAHGLPLKKSGKEPKVEAELVLGGTSHKTKVCDRSTSPQWDEAFHFLVHDPKHDELIVKLTHTEDQPTGSLVLPVRELLSEPGLVVDRWLRLDGVPPESQILLRAELKILDTKMPERGVLHEELVGAAEEEDEAQHTLPSRQEASPSNQEQERLRAGPTKRANEQGPPSAPAAPHPPASVPEKGKVGTAAEVPSPPKTRPQQTTPDPSFATEGVLRILLVEARDLIAKDKFLGKGKSDPYANIRVGGVAFRSHVIEKNLNPTWNELYEVVLTPQPGQDVQVELFDKDMDKDDFLGKFKVSLKDIITSQYVDQWFTLNDVKSGRVHLVLEWLPKVSDPDRLEQVLQFQSQQSYLNKAVPSAAVLFVYMDRAHGLPLKKSGKEPKVGAELVLRDTSHKTKVCDRSTSPQWKEAFHFLVHDPKHDMLIVKLTHTGDQPTGSLVLPVRELLSEPGLVLDRWLRLDGVPPGSQILLRAELKVLDTKMAQSGGVQGGPASSAAANQGLRLRPDGQEERGQVKLSLSYLTKEKKLAVTVHACRHLAAGGKEVSDPYVSFILLPDKHKATKRKTSVKKREVSPEYNERFEFPLSLEEARRRQLDLSVKNTVSFMNRDREVIGKVQLDLSRVDLATGVTQWYELKEEAG